MRQFTQDEIRVGKAYYTQELFWIDYPHKEDWNIYSSLHNEALELVRSTGGASPAREIGFDLLVWFFSKNGIDITK